MSFFSILLTLSILLCDTSIGQFPVEVQSKTFLLDK